MSQPIRLTESTVRPIKIVESTIKPIDPAAVAAALGAEPTGDRVPPAGPVTQYALRAELYRRRAGGPDHRRKVMVSDQDWARIEDLAATLGERGASPSQVASVLMSMALDAGFDRDAVAARLAAAKSDPPAA